MQLTDNEYISALTTYTEGLCDAIFGQDPVAVVIKRNSCRYTSDMSVFLTHKSSHHQELSNVNFNLNRAKHQVHGLVQNLKRRVDNSKGPKQTLDEVIKECTTFSTPDDVQGYLDEVEQAEALVNKKLTNRKLGIELAMCNLRINGIFTRTLVVDQYTMYLFQQEMDTGYASEVVINTCQGPVTLLAEDVVNKKT